MTGTKLHTRSSPQSSHHNQPPTHRAKTSSPGSIHARGVSSSIGHMIQPSGTGLRSPQAHQGSRTPSPNYFGLAIDPASDPRDSAAGPKANWSPPTSSIRSFHGATPQLIPAEVNPEYELFRRQTEGGTPFTLGGHSNLARFASSPSVRTARSSRQHDAAETSPKTLPRPKDSTPMDVDEREVAPTTQHSYLDAPRHASPAQMLPMHRSQLSALDDRHPRLSLPHNKVDPPSPHPPAEHRHSSHQRADTLPVSLEEGPSFMTATEFKHLIDSIPTDKVLLLDLRVYPQYSQSRIWDALNLCIPTTLLKRLSFNLQKLEETFTGAEEKRRFAKWREAEYIIVYDASSSEKKDAVSALNTLKKFTSEGWTGHARIIKGGHAAVAKECPKLIDYRSAQELQSSQMTLSLGGAIPEVAPVAGGCMMPMTKNPAMPFFSNIRQNQDLIDGVGQLDVQLPNDMDHAQDHVPRWLLKATAHEDHGKDVADKFLHLELDEKSRMTKALSGEVQYGTPTPSQKDVMIAGIEKGAKNRYNNIWPFEHTRVKLQGRAQGACDYINANYVHATGSNKRYIASQGPLPTTFEDFWSLIWDQDVRVIIMLTAESEGGQLKCHPYWSSAELGPLKLKALSEKKVALEQPFHRTTSSSFTHTVSSEGSSRRRANSSGSTPVPVHASSTNSEIPYATLRKFSLSHAAHPFQPMREITQIQYSSWPDFGAPAKPSQLLGLVELGDALERAAGPSLADNGLNRPVLVHCSAGCGRTGTYCTVDSVIDMLKQQRKNDPHAHSPSAAQPMDIDSSFPASASSTQSGSLPRIGNLNTSASTPEQTQSLFHDEDGWLHDQDTDLINSTVQQFRGQRISMVQSLRQFVLCYETVLEWCAKEERAEIKGTSGRGAGGLRAEGIRTVSGNLLTAAMNAVKEQPHVHGSSSLSPEGQGLERQR